MSKAKKQLDMQKKIAGYCKEQIKHYSGLKDFREKHLNEDGLNSFEDAQCARYFAYRCAYEDILERIATQNWTKE